MGLTEGSACRASVSAELSEGSVCCASACMWQADGSVCCCEGISSGVSICGSSIIFSSAAR